MMVMIMKTLMAMSLLLLTVDTPDPYIILYIKDSPNGWQQTTVKDNDTKPIWNETFSFFLDSETDNTLGG